MSTTNTTPFPQTNIWIPISPNRQRNSSDGKILLAAVLCLFFVVILVAVLHLFVRSILRRRGRLLLVNAPSNTMITAPQAHYQTSSGLDPSVLAAIPTATYRNRGEAPIECAVCLSAVEEGEGVRLLPGCKHAFHVSCIDVWLHAHCTCPVCRASVEPAAAAAAGVEEGTSPTGAKEGSSGSRLGSSFRMMLSGRQWSGRRGAVHGDGGMEDLESQ